MPTQTHHTDLAIIGGGAAGLTAAQAARQLGVKVALIEANRLGGECTWTGCVPSKALLAAAKTAHAARHASNFGIQTGEVTVDFPAVMAYVRRVIEDIYQEETPAALEEMGVRVFISRAEFKNPHTLLLSNGDTVQAKYILLATGSRPMVPAGLAEVPYLTNETLFGLEERPGHLIIVGGGPIGTEMAQAFNRLGSRVTLVEELPRILPRDEPEASEFIMNILREEGVELRLGVRAAGATGTAGDITLKLQAGSTVQGDQLLVAIGKRPSFEGLNLAAAGVETEEGRLVIQDNLQTTQPHIYAAGDAAGGAQFTHYAGWQAFQAVRNMFIPFSAKGFRDTVPWTTFTEPEVAHAGLSEAAAREQFGGAVQITRVPMTRSDRAMTEGEAQGFIKLVHKGNGRLLGATIVGYNAGEMINEWQMLVEKKGRVWEVPGVMHVYPTQGVANTMVATEQITRQVEGGFIGWLLRRVARVAR